MLEPNLEIKAIGALYSPEEYTVDPYLMVLSNLYVALHHGCQLGKGRVQTTWTEFWAIVTPPFPLCRHFYKIAVIKCCGHQSNPLVCPRGLFTNLFPLWTDNETSQF